MVDHWMEIDAHFSMASADKDNAEIPFNNLILAIDEFYYLLDEFNRSALYRSYSALSSHSGRSLSFSLLEDIEEVNIILDSVLVFRDSVISGDMEEARAASAGISGILYQLLIMDTDTQRQISSSYFRLLLALMIFIFIIALIIRLLHISLTRSLKREAEGILF